MRLFLAQHGQAMSKEENPERPLTERGRDETTRVARSLVPLDLGLGRIVHSGKLRAAETAEIFASSLKPRAGVERRDGLAPLDDPSRIREALDELEDATLLVGHLPHLSRLAGSLLAGDPEAEPVAFRYAGVACLESDGEGWRLRWYLTPELASA